MLFQAVTLCLGDCSAGVETIMECNAQFHKQGQTHLPILLTPIFEFFNPATSRISRLAPVLIAQPENARSISCPRLRP